MASKLNLDRYRRAVSPGSSSVRGVSEPEVIAEPVRPVITPAVLDEAVKNVMDKSVYAPEVKETFRRLLASDTNAGFATSFHLGKAGASVDNVHPKLARRSMRIGVVCQPDEVADLVSYAPEFDMNFTDEEHHDHPVAMSMRKIDSELIMSGLPVGIPIKDVGGDPVYHALRGSKNVSVCDPFEDMKDPSRRPIREMRMRAVAGDAKMPEQVRANARRYLVRDPSYCCGLRAQDCDAQAKITMSIHVYDVPLQDWPKIMQRSGAVMHVGVILFPTLAYAENVGELKMARARYVINPDEGTFHMGFKNSPSWWYSHNWLDFMRYGVDQIIGYEGARYSYKITERRGDSLFFQILKVSGDAHLERQCFKLPSVPMVRVEGFEYGIGKVNASMVGSRKNFAPKVHWFPAALWQDMMQQASMDFERGVMSYDRLYNYYRTVSARNTINGVLISGGQRVSQEEIVSLITHVGISAAASVSIGQRTSRYLIQNEMEKRNRANDNMFAQLTRSFLTAVKGVARGMVYYPVIWLCDMFVAKVDDLLIQSLVSWEYVPQIQYVPFSSLVGESYVKRHADWSLVVDDVEYEFRDHYVVTERADHIRALHNTPALADLVTKLCASELTKSELSSLEQVSASSAEVSQGTTFVATDKTDNLDKQVVARRLAIRESIEESELEEKKLIQSCSEVFRAVVSESGQPNERLLVARAEEYNDPDVWLVRNGVLLSSVLGNEPLECKYAALFTPRSDPTTGSHFRVLKDVTFVGDDGVVKEYKVFGDDNYSGYALSVERLEIFNGPEMRATLKVALGRPMDFHVRVRQGPPGSGKTTALIGMFTPGDAAVCPVKASAIDTRKKIAKKFPAIQDVKSRVGTVQSYLINYDNRKDLKAEVLFIDEAYMAPSGWWYAMAALLGVKVVEAFGDEEQIPHVPRVQAPSEYVKIIGDEVVTTYEDYRNPGDSVAAWNHRYDWKVRATSKIVNSMSEVSDWRSVPMPRGCVMLCMYQADKKQLKKVFASYVKPNALQIMTVHESQGKTFEHVWLFRFDTRPRSDGMSLFDKTPYVIVAMSRHTTSFVSIRPRVVRDKVYEWMENASNVRAVMAAMDVKSAGTSVKMK